jgi:uncharacterized protein (TIGR00369 family)
MVEDEPGPKYTHVSRGCFGCGTENQVGLSLRPRHEGEWIVADFVPKPHHRGFSRVVHGGIIASVLDEIVSAAASIAAGRLTTTRSLEVEFLRPVLLTERYEVRGRATAHEGDTRTAEAELRAADGKPVARARGQFVELTPERAEKFLNKIK